MSLMVFRTLGVALLVLAPLTVAAQEITFNFTGTVADMSAQLSGGPFVVGQAVSGSYTFDPTAVDEDPSPVVGRYRNVTAFRFSVAGYAGAAFPGTSRGTIRVVNDQDGQRDEYIVSMSAPGQNLSGPAVLGYSLDGLAIVLRDRTTLALSSDALPLTPPSLSDFAFGREFFIEFTGPTGDALVYVQLTSLTGASTSQLLEELVQLVVTLNAQAGISNSLDAKLSMVMRALDDANERNDVAARNAMYAFINAVEAQRGRKLAAEQADQLIQLAEAILDGL